MSCLLSLVFGSFSFLGLATLLSASCSAGCLRSPQRGHLVALALVDGNSLKLPGCPLLGFILSTHVRWSLQVRQYLCCRCFTASASQVTSLVLLSVAEAVRIAASVFSPSESRDCSSPCTPSNTLSSATCVSGRPPPPPASCLRLMCVSRLCLSLRRILRTSSCLVFCRPAICLRLCSPRFSPSLHLCLVRVLCTLTPTPRPMYTRLTHSLVHAPRISCVLLATSCILPAWLPHVLAHVTVHTAICVSCARAYRASRPCASRVHYMYIVPYCTCPRPSSNDIYVAHSEQMSAIHVIVKCVVQYRANHPIPGIQTHPDNCM